MKQLFLYLTLATLLAACGPSATPAPTADLQATMGALAGTMTAGTLTAQPTNTNPPTVTPIPTETPTPLPPTDTPPTGTAEPAIADTLTPVPLNGLFAPLGIEGLPMGVFRIENNTDYQISVYLNGVTKPGEKVVNYGYKVDHSMVFNVPWGSYSYIVQIGDKKTITGRFAIANKDKTTMRVYMDKVVIVGP